MGRVFIIISFVIALIFVPLLTKGISVVLSETLFSEPNHEVDTKNVVILYDNSGNVQKYWITSSYVSVFNTSDLVCIDDLNIEIHIKDLESVKSEYILY